MLTELTKQLDLRVCLSDDQVESAVRLLTDEYLAVEDKAAFLTALARKGEETSEIAAFARELRERSVPVPLDAATRSRGILDVCGTGGDRLNTFNISTTVAILVAAAGVTVAKHGNRAITSQSGSADVLEALGIRTDLTPEQAAESLKRHQFAFLFAPRFHPVFKHIAPARKLCAERGQRTIFNFLGPLLNPARPTAQLIGVPRPELCAPMAQVLQTLGIQRGMVVCGTIPAEKQRAADPRSAATSSRDEVAFLDEFSTLGGTHIAEFYQPAGFATSVALPDHYPIQPATLADLTGGDREANAAIVQRILFGEERGPRRDAVLLNAGAALFVADKTGSVAEGWDLAEEVIDTGRARAKLEELRQG